MSFISYAQNGEDVILWRALNHIDNGFYIDIGACDPNDLSVTRAFYNRGWSGINVEPSKEQFEACVAARPRDISLNLAVAEKAGFISFSNFANTGLSTMIDVVADAAVARGFDVEMRQVSAVTLADICALAAGREIHFLKIDVEGGELMVLSGADFNRFRPWIIVVEATVPGKSERNEQVWEPLVLEAGYDRCLFDGLNLYYLAREHRELAALLNAGANVLDGYEPIILVDTQQKLDNVQQELQKARQEILDAHQKQRDASRKCDELRADLEKSKAAYENAMAHIDRLTCAHDAFRVELQSEQSRLLGTVDEKRRANDALNLVLAETMGRLTAITRSRSWRITAPMRLMRVLLGSWLTRKILGRKRRLDALAMRQIHFSEVKEVARHVFHNGVLIALRLPGGRRGAWLARRVAPEAIDWLALRFRAYEERARAKGNPRHALTSMSSITAEKQSLALDLSDEEARIYQQVFSCDPIH